MYLFRLHRSRKSHPRVTATRKHHLSRFSKELEEIPEEDQRLASTFESSSDDDDEDESSSLDCESYLPSHYSALLSIKRMSSWDDDTPFDEFEDSSEPYGRSNCAVSTGECYEEPCSVPVPQAITSPQSNNEGQQDDYFFLNEFKEELKVDFENIHKIPNSPSIKEFRPFHDFDEEKDDESLIVFESDSSSAEESANENDPFKKYETKKVKWNDYREDTSILSPNIFYYGSSSSSSRDNNSLVEEESKATTRRNNCTSQPPRGYKNDFFSKQYYATQATNTWIIDMADRMLDFLICK